MISGYVVGLGGTADLRPGRGDEAGRAEAVAYGRSVGTPAHQFDWPE
ncbi:hypothetical protein ACFUIY_00390 [Streptomyces griseorubiginosus]|nr:hypothetical protein [Streptomyces griseorubiginosus]